MAMMRRFQGMNSLEGDRQGPRNSLECHHSCPLLCDKGKVVPVLN